MKYLKLYPFFISVFLKSKMEYKFSFYSGLLVQFSTYSVEYLGIWILLNKFHHIQSWQYYEVVFLFSLNLLAFGISGFVMRDPMQRIQEYVHQGTFDGILVYPLNPLYHLSMKNFDYYYIGHIILSCIAIGFCINVLDIDWSVLKVFWLISVIFGATLIVASVMLITGSTCFWIIKSRVMHDTFIYGVRRFIDFPISIYDKWIQVLLTFVIPYAFINYYPVSGLLEKGEMVLFHPLLNYITPLVGIVMFAVAYQVWCTGVRQYQSTGS